MRKNIIISILIITLVILTGCNNQTTGNVIKEKTIKIGITSSLTGAYSSQGQGHQQGIIEAFNDIDYKINNNKIELIFEDNALDPKKAISDFYSFQSKDANILFTQFTHISRALAPVVENNKAIMMFASMDPTIAEETKYSFKLYSDAESDAKKITELINNEEVATIYVNLQQGQKFNEILKQDLDNKITSFAIEKGELDYKTIILKLKQKEIKTVCINAYQNQILAFMKQATELDYNPKQVLVSAGGYKAIVEEVEEYTNISGTKYITAWYGNTNLDIDAAFSYDQSKLLIKAMKNCGKKGFEIDDSECLKEELKKVSFNGRTGFVKIDKDGNGLTTPELYTIKNKELVLI